MIMASDAEMGPMHHINLAPDKTDAPPAWQCFWPTAVTLHEVGSQGMQHIQGAHRKKQTARWYQE
jgi:hypothetical protein